MLVVALVVFSVHGINQKPRRDGTYIFIDCIDCESKGSSGQYQLRHLSIDTSPTLTQICLTCPSEPSTFHLPVLSPFKGQYIFQHYLSSSGPVAFVIPCTQPSTVAGTAVTCPETHSSLPTQQEGQPIYIPANNSIDY